MSSAGPSIAVLQKALRQDGENSHAACIAKELASSKLVKYFDMLDIENFIDMCTYVDPRFRAFQQKIESKPLAEEKLCSELEKIITEKLMSSMQNAPAQSPTKRSSATVVSSCG